MSEPEQDHDQPISMGVFDRSGKRRISASEIIALAMSLIWLGGCAIFFLVLGGETDPNASGPQSDPFRLVMTMLAVFMPIALIWVAAAATQSARIMREESERLQAAIDGMRHTYLQQQHSSSTAQGPSAMERKLDQIAHAQRQTESAIATFTSSRPSEMPLKPAAKVVAPEPASDEEQPTFELGTQAAELATPLAISDFISAMNFPETEDDRDGFRALRLALEDHQIAGLVRAAQDVLTLLSQDGIYMDDLRADLARPEVWRSFASGARGRSIAPLGGVRDRSSLALAAGRMRKDPIFRDATHHFLRRFDLIYSNFAAEATDAEIVAMSDTRTSRAFMLLGRVTGTFD